MKNDEPKKCVVCGDTLVRSWITLGKGEHVCAKHVDFKALAVREQARKDAEPKPKRRKKRK